MNVQTLKIFIQSLFDSKGTEDASKAVGDLGQKSKDADKAAGNLGGAAGKAAGAMSQMNAALSQGGPQAQKMAAGLRAVSAVAAGLSGGLVGLATVAIAGGIAAWTAWQRKVEESKKKLQEFRDKIEEANRAKDADAVSRLATQYDVLRRAIDDASSAQDRLNQAQAAADNADKAADLAELSLREKEALANADAPAHLKKTNPEAAAKLEDLNKAKIANQFAQERRSIEEKYAIAAAEREDEAAARRLADSERKEHIAQADVDKAKEAMDEFADNIRKANEELRDLADNPPMKRHVVAAQGPFDKGVDEMVIDKEEKDRREAELKKRIGRAGYKNNELVDPDSDGDHYSLSMSYMKAAEALAAHLDRLAKEKVETHARDIESRAASRQHETAANLQPEVNRADAALEDKALRDQQRDANAALFRGRLKSLRERAETETEYARREAATFNPQRRDYGSQSAFEEAKRKDRGLDRKADELRDLFGGLTKLTDAIANAPLETITSRLASESRRLDSFEKKLNDYSARARQP